MSRWPSWIAVEAVMTICGGLLVLGFSLARQKLDGVLLGLGIALASAAIWYLFRDIDR